jgi:hypothetical protein
VWREFVVVLVLPNELDGAGLGPSAGARAKAWDSHGDLSPTSGWGVALKGRRERCVDCVLISPPCSCPACLLFHAGNQAYLV